MMGVGAKRALGLYRSCAPRQLRAKKTKKEIRTRRAIALMDAENQLSIGVPPLTLKEKTTLDQMMPCDPVLCQNSALLHHLRKCERSRKPESWRCCRNSRRPADARMNK